MKIRKKITAAVISSFLSLGALAQADDAGFYVQGSVGWGTLLSNDFHDTSSGVAGGAALGYQFNNWAATELNSYFFPDANDSVNNSLASIAIKLTLPLHDRFGIYGKGGPAVAHTRVNVENNGDTENISTNNFVLMYGIGAHYKLTNSFSFNLEVIGNNSNNEVSNRLAVLGGISYLF